MFKFSSVKINNFKPLQKVISFDKSIKRTENNIFNKTYLAKRFSTAAVNLNKEIQNEINNQIPTNSNEDYNIKLILPNFIKPSFIINKNATFKDLSVVIKKSFNFENIEFRTWDHSTISLGNDLRSCMESGNLIFMRIDNFEWQLINYDLISKDNSDVFNESKKTF